MSHSSPSQPTPFTEAERATARAILGEKRPDFIIAGSMKCGTSSLHHNLEQHPQVFIPPGEIKFFSLDDFEQQRHHFRHLDGQWVQPNFLGELEDNMKWYRDHFEPAPAGQMIGEDSPTYLPSAPAAERIADLLPNIQILIILRDPVARAYSQYWHQVRNGSATRTFENTIQYAPDTLLQRGFYLQQIKRYYRLFPANQIHVILFEQLIAEPRTTMASTFDFLGLPPHELTDSLHKNAGRVPRHLNLALWKNRKDLDQFGQQYLLSMPSLPPPADSSKKTSLLNKVHRRINPMLAQKPPTMSEDTRKFLNRFYMNENHGLDQYLNLDLAAWWPSWNKSV